MPGTSKSHIKKKESRNENLKTKYLVRSFVYWCFLDDRLDVIMLELMQHLWRPLDGCCQTSHSLVIFKMSSSIFMSCSISLLGFSCVATHWPLFLSIGWFPGATLQPRQHLTVRAATTLSQGSREWSHSGRKSQERNTRGRDPGFLCCTMLITTTPMSRRSRGTTTAISSDQPASDRLKMKRGSKKKQPRM